LNGEAIRCRWNAVPRRWKRYLDSLLLISKWTLADEEMCNQILLGEERVILSNFKPISAYPLGTFMNRVVKIIIHAY